MTCTGNSKEICGAKPAISIYKRYGAGGGDVDSSSGGSKICYRDSGDDRHAPGLLGKRLDDPQGIVKFVYLYRVHDSLCRSPISRGKPYLLAQWCSSTFDVSRDCVMMTPFDLMCNARSRYEGNRHSAAITQACNLCAAEPSFVQQYFPGVGQICGDFYKMKSATYYGLEFGKQ